MGAGLGSEKGDGVGVKSEVEMVWGRRHEMGLSPTTPPKSCPCRPFSSLATYSTWAPKYIDQVASVKSA